MMKHYPRRGLAAVCAAVLLAAALPLSVSARADQEIGRMAAAPTVDGVVAKDEWGAPSFTIPNYDTSTVPGDSGKVDLDGTVYLGYDETHFYLAIEAVYDEHDNQMGDYDLWRGDALQMQLSAPGRSDRRSFCFALGTDGVCRGYQSGEHKELYEVEEAGGEFYVRRNEETKTTTYELALPLSRFSSAASLAEGGEIAFSFAIHMHDGYYYEWAGGVVTEKSIDRAALLTLGGVKDQTTPSEPEKPEPPKPVERTLLLGDVDGNEKTDTTDARMVLQKAVGKIELTGDALLTADVNNDQSVDTTDARLILQRAVNKIDTFPAGDIITITEEPLTPQTPNTLTFDSEQAGYAFFDIDGIWREEPEITDSTKHLELFTLTTQQNPNLPFSVACYIDREAGRITALLPSGLDLSAVVPTFFYYGASISAGGQPLVSEETVLDLTEDVVLTLAAADGSESQLTVHVETLSTGLPSVAVTTTQLDEISSKEEYMTAGVYVGGGDGTVCDYAPREAQLVAGSVKGRGNSSWMQPKRSFTVKLDEKARFLGMSKSKNWVLVSNYEDKSLLRNYLAAYLSEEVAGAEYTMKARPVDLWLNGQYFGNYLLMEKIELEGDRVNITDYKDALEANGGVIPDADQVGYLLEFDAHVMEKDAGTDNVTVLDPNRWREYGWSRIGPAYYNPETDETFFPVPIGGKWVTIKKPSTKNLTPEMVRYIYNVVTDAAECLQSGNYQAIEERLDVRSFVKWYLIEEFMNNTDASMHSSVYMTLDVGGKLKLGPVWDFDRSSGNCDYWNAEGKPDSLYSSGAGWFRPLFETAQARAILREEWASFKAGLGDLDLLIEDWADMIYRSQELNFRLWDILEMDVGANSDEVLAAQTFEAQVKWLKTFLADRASRLDRFYSTIG